MNEQKIREIVRKEILDHLGDTKAIPYEVQEAIKSRLGSFVFTVSNKDVTTERDQSDDNLGVHYAQAVADGYLELVVEGSTYYFPVYFSAS